MKSCIEKPKVSVIIPCFNHAKYLNDSIGSVLAQTYSDYEIIVVDDGSTSEEDRKIFESLDFPKTTLIRQRNMGLAAARNTGISKALGEYILPLDADDMIKPMFLEKAVSVLDSDSTVGIVGGGVEFFGAECGKWELPMFAMPGYLWGNCLVCTHLYRKADWELVGGYNSNMKYGWEDWDMWLSFVELGRKVVQFREILFLYRKHRESMITKLNDEERMRKMKKQLVANHRALYSSSPERTYFFINGKHSKKYVFLKTMIDLVCKFVPGMTRRQRLRSIYQNMVK